MNTSWHTHNEVMPHIWIRHGTHTMKSCHTYEYVMANVQDTKDVHTKADEVLNAVIMEYPVHAVCFCVAVCCSVLQCVAVCCSVSQCIAVCRSVLQCIAVCCSVLQCIVVYCNVLQCVAVSCRASQCVAVWCSVSQCVAVYCSAVQCHHGVPHLWGKKFAMCLFSICVMCEGVYWVCAHVSTRE